MIRGTGLAATGSEGEILMGKPVMVGVDGMSVVPQR